MALDSGGCGQAELHSARRELLAEVAHAAPVARLRRQLDGVCGRIEPADTQRSTCDALARSLAPKSA